MSKPQKVLTGAPTVKLSLWSLLVYPKEIRFPSTSISKDQVKRLQCLRSRWWKKEKNPHLKLGVGTIWNLLSGYISESSPRFNANLTFLDQTTKHMPSPRHSEYRVREPCWFCLAPCSSRELKSTTEPAGTTTSTILSPSPACQIPTKKREQSDICTGFEPNKTTSNPLHNVHVSTSIPRTSTPIQTWIYRCSSTTFYNMFNVLKNQHQAISPLNCKHLPGFSSLHRLGWPIHLEHVIHCRANAQNPGCESPAPLAGSRSPEESAMTGGSAKLMFLSLLLLFLS